MLKLKMVDNNLQPFCIFLQQQQPGMMMNRPMGMGMQPMMGMQPQPGAYGAPMMAQPRQATPQSMNDPFGAL